MASEWARALVRERHLCGYHCGDDSAICDCGSIAAALDEARAEGEKAGAERERWECCRLAQLNIVSSSPGSWNDAVDVIAGRIAARGAMRDGTD